MIYLSSPVGQKVYLNNWAEYQIFSTWHKAELMLLHFNKLKICSQPCDPFGRNGTQGLTGHTTTQNRTSRAFGEVRPFFYLLFISLILKTHSG